MLVLGRKKGESIRIGENIEISILEITNDSVRIGITAPKEVGVLRKELYISVEDMNRNAEQSTISASELLNQFSQMKKK